VSSETPNQTQNVDRDDSLAYDRVNSIYILFLSCTFCCNHMGTIDVDRSTMCSFFLQQCNAEWGIRTFGCTLIQCCPCLGPCHPQRKFNRSIPKPVRIASSIFVFVFRRRGIANVACTLENYAPRSQFGKVFIIVAPPSIIIWGDFLFLAFRLLFLLLRFRF